MIDKEIKQFVQSLSQPSSNKTFINQYSYESKSNKIRRANLLAYLSRFKTNKSNILLVGEAPGYRGSRRTGVPFSSEKILITNRFFNSNNKFEIENATVPYEEISASIVWKTMDELQFYPLIWSSFPFHPHELQNKETNRRPTIKEINLGKKYLKQLIDIFEIQIIVSVGRIAQKTLNDLGFQSTYLRHPSHGGAKLFQVGLSNIKKGLLHERNKKSCNPKITA